MKVLTIRKENKYNIFSKFLPYGVLESWEDLNPKLYHSVHIYWLKFYGMWYNNYSPKSLSFWLHITYTLVVLWLVCFLPGFGEIVYLMRRTENIGDIASGLYLFLSEMYTYFKLLVFWLNKNKILDLLKYLHCDEFKPKEIEHRDILRKSIKKSRFIMTYYSTMCVCAVLVGVVMPLTENFEILPTNVEYPYINVYKSPAYNIIYLHQIFYKPATCIIDGAMDTILAAFITSAIGQIEILAYNIRNFNVLSTKKFRSNIRGIVKTKVQSKDMYVQNVLKNCIKHHNAIIRYVAMIESAFSLASALQFMLSVMVLCLVGIQFMSIKNPGSHPMQILWMAIYLTCMLIEVFILCWFGNELILKSQDLRHAVFDSPWFDMNTKHKYFLIILLERCKRPLRVTAGKIFTLSLDTYTILINWSYKAFAVMRNMKSNFVIGDSN